MKQCGNCSCCDAWQPRYNGMVSISRRLFDALLTRIYHRSEFTRLGPPQPEERQVIEEYRLARQADDEQVEFVGVHHG